MKIRKPPRHRIDAPIVYIHPADEAWDTEAIAKSEEEHGRECPWIRYHSGATRFDATEVQRFLTGSPTEFHLRRLSTLQLIEVQTMVDREYGQACYTLRTAYLLALRYGLTAVKQGGMPFVDLTSPGNLSNSDVETLAQISDIGISLLRSIGEAVYLASQPLSEDEKKP